MRRFVLHAMSFMLLQLAILAIAWRTCPEDPNHYMAATLDKHARLRTAAAPRVIFVGGSSVSFGIDSREFVPLGLTPVNMGLSVGLGLPFMLGEIETQLRPGDVAIIAPETHLYWAGAKDDAVWEVLQRRPASLRCLVSAGPRAVTEIFDQGLHFLARRLRCAVHQVTSDRELATLYRRASFDASGDFVAHRGLVPRTEQFRDPDWPAPESLDLEPAIAALQRFAKACERAGAHCFIAWCPVHEVRFAREADVFALLEARLHAEVELPMLERPAEQVYDAAAFFDAPPHLTSDAAAARSRRLARRLAERLDLPAPAATAEPPGT